ncbi:MAG: efflux RND transporter periplasmic adaptor subunit [Planctomycetes bacterium]|nr:efflux RND transporter periplasmic adaptor subunit [Planctomycetota bacterium]
MVLTRAVERGRLERVVRQAAALYAFEEVAVFAKISGYAREVKADIGDRVEAGQVLVSLELPEHEADLLGARAEVKTAEAQVKRSTAAVSLKRAVHELTKSLFEKEGRTRFQLEEAQADLELSMAELELARAKLEEAGARVTRVAALVEFGQVRAPFAGIITQRLVDTGALVRAGGSGDARPLFVVQRTDKLRCRVEIPERDVVLVLGAARAKTLFVRLVLDALPGEVFELNPEEIAAGAGRFAKAVHPESHHMLAELDIPNADEKLLPGLYGKATLEARGVAGEAVVLAPNTAMHAPRGGKPFVFVVKEEDGKTRLEERPVGLGLTDGTLTEVLSGLEPGERVVVRGGGGLVRGQEVAARPDVAPRGAP